MNDTGPTAGVAWDSTFSLVHLPGGLTGTVGMLAGGGGGSVGATGAGAGAAAGAGT